MINLTAYNYRFAKQSMQRKHPINLCLAIYRKEIKSPFLFRSFFWNICVCVCVYTCVFIHIVPFCIYTAFHHDDCDKVIEVTVVHNEHLTTVSTAKPLFSVSYFIRAHACGFPQGITQCILVLQNFIIYFIRTLTFPVSLGSLARLIIKHFKIELLQFMCMYIYTTWGREYLLLQTASEPCPE